jgi:hypothetical protein
MIPSNPYLLDLGLPEKPCVENVTDFLLNGTSSNPQAKAASCCWLTYRVCEGKMKFEDWQEQILPHHFDVPGDEHLTARWAMSQATANTYAFFLRGTHQEGADRALAAMELWNDGVHRWSGGCECPQDVVVRPDEESDSNE